MFKEYPLKRERASICSSRIQESLKHNWPTGYIQLVWLQKVHVRRFSILNHLQFSKQPAASGILMRLLQLLRPGTLYPNYPSHVMPVFLYNCQALILHAVLHANQLAPRLQRHPACCVPKAPETSP